MHCLKEDQSVVQKEKIGTYDQNDDIIIDEPQDIPAEHVKSDNNDDADNVNELRISTLFLTFTNSPKNGKTLP